MLKDSSAQDLTEVLVTEEHSPYFITKVCDYSGYYGFCIEESVLYLIVGSQQKKSPGQ